MASDPDLDGSAHWPHYINHTETYSPSNASTASSSSDSVFSVDAPSSQSSVTSEVWSNSSERSSWINETEVQFFGSRDGTLQASEEHISTNRSSCSIYQALKSVQPVALESRQHPRRTHRFNSSESQDGQTGASCPRPPPSLVRQSERKDNFVDSLVGKLINVATRGEYLLTKPTTSKTPPPK